MKTVVGPQERRAGWKPPPRHAGAAGRGAGRGGGGAGRGGGKKAARADAHDAAPAPSAAGAVTDARFAKAFNDPRFRRAPKSLTKVSVDKRFERMFNDKSFAPDYVVDKYGRKVQQKRGRDELKRFYKLDNEDEDKEEGDKTEEAEEVEDEVDEAYDPARGIGVTSSSSDESGSEDGGDGVLDSDTERDLTEFELKTLDKLEIPEGEATRRFAVLSMDWDKLKAVDLLALFQSFKPKNGSVLSVRIYPSQFGKERMAEEDRIGPQRFVFRDADSDASRKQAAPRRTGGQRTHKEEDDEDENEEEDEAEDEEDEEEEDEEDEEEEDQEEEDDEEEEEDEEDDQEDEEEDEEDENEKDGGEDEKAELIRAGIVPQQGDAASDVDYVKLRRYQIERLRYFFAVVECDSVATADAIYTQCDGLEYEGSANVLDLRFIPDDMSYDDEQPREVATAVPTSYKPVLFETKALQHSKVDLTWDDDDPVRMTVTRRKFSRDDLKTVDFNSYLASEDSSLSSGDDDDDAEDTQPNAPEDADAAARRLARLKARRKAQRKKYKALLSEVATTAEPDQEMEITFTTGLPDVARKLLRQKEKQKAAESQTVWDAYLEKRREKRKARRAEKHGKRDADDDDASDDASDDANEDANDGSDADDDGSSSGGELDHDSDEGEAAPKTAAQTKAERKAEADRKRAELELLMLDETDSSTAKHFDMKEVARAEKAASKPGKKSRRSKVKEALAKKAAEDTFAMDVADPRFAAVFDSPQFAIDPSNPHYTKTKGMKALLEERQRRRQERDAERDRKREAVNAPESAPAPAPAKGAGRAADNGLADLVAAVKRRPMQPQNAPVGKRRKAE